MDIKPGPASESDDYALDTQVGFVLRQVQQRHSILFAELFGGDLTPTQWAVLAKLGEIGECSQNLLGRYTAMDVATIKGVVQRLFERGLLTRRPDPDDRRQLLISMSPDGNALFRHHLPNASRVSEVTLAPLTAPERARLLSLLARLR
ncbi:transcriptional regulator [Aureimonas sp. SA4125]|uniref:MarR family winged helix-turn-helix transcriptional regulator n=1 Tax=Aureimonas sp. SA4125 TaxID=2826993 RepID=UPI001CC5E1CD|nr:MarR family transcriptional regulator [Aureimonas sp. SA4125]BDA86527.1 transcriptional regulator [Aureimonas sp. SA4125]